MYYSFYSVISVIHAIMKSNLLINNDYKHICLGHYINTFIFNEILIVLSINILI